MAAHPLSVFVLPELGGYWRQDGRRTESGGNSPNWHRHQVRRRPGARTSVPDPSDTRGAGGHVQQHPSPRLWQLTSGCAVRREHRGSGWRRLRVLDVQQTRPREQRILHPERLPPGAQLQQRTSRRAAGRVWKLEPRHLQILSWTPDVWAFFSFKCNSELKVYPRLTGQPTAVTEWTTGKCFVESLFTPTHTWTKHRNNLSLVQK